MQPLDTNVPRSVCVSAGHNHDSCKNTWSDRDAVWAVDSGGPKKTRIKWGRDPPGEGAILGDMSHPIIKYRQFSSELQKNGWPDQQAVRDEDKEPCVRWTRRSPRERGNFGGLFSHWNALDSRESSTSSKRCSATGRQSCVQGTARHSQYAASEWTHLPRGDNWCILNPLSYLPQNGSTNQDAVKANNPWHGRRLSLECWY